MIIGNGMIAKAFLKYTLEDNLIIFASGVSNSQEKDQTKFDREFNLLKQHIKNQNHIVYFSTISIYDVSLKDTHYIKHKNKIEQYIKENCNSYNIFRLPIVVGNTDNNYTLIKFLYTQIIKGETLSVFMRACRSILDVEDLAFIVYEILKLGAFKNDTLDIYLSPNTPILNIIESLEISMHVKANKRMIDKGNCYEIKDDRLKYFLNQINYILKDDYIFKTINKYYYEAKQR